ncbi:filamentous hemagglutinin N-terminal domain-containing protein [Bradyrhizobium sp. SZCCHNR1018]|uniref:two-partner secretion domain-containing protein n=1 Tax=unclassified Bradyrhizobium TaxID=2631580 RepID=UPI0039656758
MRAFDHARNARAASGWRRRAALLLGCTSLLAISSRALAQAGLPQGGSVVSGQATIGAPAGNTLTINQTSSRAIVDWNSFSVSAGNSVNFVQPNSSAAILNRVTGTTTSTIAGQVSANGQVFLVNPNGIAITPTGSVQVGGGFVASTLDIGNADFNAGRLIFTGKGASAAVSNAGAISGASGAFVGLIGGTVSNSGTITVPLGRVGLGAGEAITLNPTGDGFLQVALPTKSTTADGKAIIDIAGRIKAAGGAIEIKAAAAQQAVRDVVNVSGVLSARSLSGRSGRIVLGGGSGAVTISGRLAANGGRSNAGGTIVVTGKKVALTATAKVSADGKSGGKVLIGGDMRGGRDPSAKLVADDVPTAETTSVAQGATISAKGSAGDGGKVVLWSEQTTDFRGSVVATGADGGNGGGAEVSSHGLLDFRGSVDLTATGGKTGTLLLDPYDVTISTAADSNMSSSGNTYSPTGNSSVLSVATLQGALATANVTVDTGSGGSQSGDITVANAVTWASGHSLTLNAARDVNVNAGISTSGGGTFSVSAGRDVNVSSSITATGGALNVNLAASGSSGSLVINGATIDTNGGALTGSAVQAGSNAAVWLANSTLNVGALTLTGTSASGNGVVFAGSNAITNTGGGTLSISGSSPTLPAFVLQAGASLDTAGAVSITGTSNSSVGVYLLGNNTITDHSGGLTLSGTTSSNVGFSINSGNNTFTNSGGGTLALNGTVTTSSGSQGIAFNSGVGLTTSGTVTLTGTSITSNGVEFQGSNLVTNTAGNLTVSGASTTGIGVFFTATPTTLTNSGTGALSISGSSAAGAGGGFGAAINSDLTTSGNISISGTDTGTSYGLYLNGSAITSNSGNLTLSGSSTGSNGVWDQGNGTLALTNAGTGTFQLIGSTPSASRGIRFNTGSNLTTLGSVSLNGSSGSGEGLSFKGSNIVTILNGTPSFAGSSTSGSGVFFQGATTIDNQGTGTATFSGTSNSGFGVNFTGTNTVSGNVSFAGISTASDGVSFGSASSLAVTGGNVAVSGISTATSGSGSTVGTYFSGATVSNSGSGSLTITGTSNDTGPTNSGSAGVLFAGTDAISNSGAGTLAISGFNPSGYGLQFRNFSAVTTSGTMSLAGTSSTGYGVLASLASFTATGSVTLTGTSNSNVGMVANGGNTLTATSGALILQGTSVSADGLQLRGTLATSGSGLVSISGTSSGGSGVAVNANVTSSGTTSISGSSTSGNGIYLRGSTTIDNLSGTAVTFAGTSTSGAGVTIDQGSTLTTSGDLQLRGTSSTASGLVASGSNAITANSGAVTLAGSTSSASAVGIDTSAAGVAITNNGTGTLILDGRGGDRLGATITSGAAPVVISDTGAVSQIGGAIAATALRLSGGTSYVLGANNTVGTLAASGIGALTFNNAQSLTIGAVQGISGISANANATILSAGDLTIASGSAVVAASPVLSAARAFINNAGSGAVSATSGRWLIYSAAPGADSFGGLDSGNPAIWNATYQSVPPGSVSAPGNRYLFAAAAPGTAGNGSSSANTDLIPAPSTPALIPPSPSSTPDSGVLNGFGAAAESVNNGRTSGGAGGGHGGLGGAASASSASQGSAGQGPAAGPAKSAAEHAAAAPPAAAPVPPPSQPAQAAPEPPILSAPPTTIAPAPAGSMVDLALSRLNREALATTIAEEISRVARSAARSLRAAEFTIAAASSVLTVGFIAWLLRGGTLLAAFLASVPLWRGFDPLMVVLRPRRTERTRATSEVDAMFEGGQGAGRSLADIT